MPDLPAGAREVADPIAVAEEFAAERFHSPEKVLHVGDAVRVYDANGTVFAGKVTGVERRQVPHPERFRFSVVCEPALGGGESG